MRNASSVKDRLKNYAKKTGRTVQDIFTVYLRGRQENAHLYRWVMNRRISRAFIFEHVFAFPGKSCYNIFSR
jgi:hypothetical protein